MRATKRTNTSVAIQSPTGGWDTRNALSDMPIENAVKLDNWFPSTDRVIMRRGFTEYATGMIGSIETLIEYVTLSGVGELYGANSGGIYDVTSAGAVGAAVSGGTPTTGYDLNNLSPVQVTKSITAEDGFPEGIVFNGDGTKIFMVGSGNDSIYEYNLSTAYDLSTISSVQFTKSIATEDTAPTGIVFNDDGSKLFLVGENGIGVGAPYDLNGLSDVQVTKSVNSEDTSPTGIAFNNDGTKIFMCGTQNNSIYEYNLSTPYDLNSISAVQVTKSVASEDAISTGIVFNDDGTKIFMVGIQNDSIYEYNLSTAFDLNSISAVQVTKSITAEDTFPEGIVFNNDGTKIFMVGAEHTSIYEYDLSTAYDISTLSAVQVTKSIASEDGFPNGIVFNDDGTKIFMVGAENDSIYEYNLSTAHDISTLSAVQVTKSIASEDRNPHGIAFNDDGTKIFMVGFQSESIYEYNLDTTESAINEYNVSTAYDLSTLSAVQETKSIESEDSNPEGIAFNDDGTKIFMVGSENDSIYEYNLSTAYDISTLSAVQVTKSIASEDTGPTEIVFNDDGTKIFLIGTTNNSIYEYDLSTAYDLSTLSAVQVTKDIYSEDMDPTGIAFNDNGTKIFMLGEENDSIYEYNMGSPGLHSNNRWQYVQISTAAGQFISLMNGEDTPVVYNGSTWGTTPAITGPTVTNLVWNNIHQRRLWCGEVDSLSAWYLPVNSIGGAATEFPMGGISRLGGYIMAMGTWTRDSGEGMDDVAVFITSEGEAIVYNGFDPASASTWQLIGVFRIGKPIGRRCIVKAGVDVVIITQDGFVPLSAILTTDRSQSRLVAVSNQIAKAVNESVRDSKDVFGWQPIVYPKGTQLLFNVPQPDNIFHQYVFNTITGSPCRFTGMNTSCWGLLDDNLFFGGLDGKTYKADDGLSDNGSNVETDAIQAFSYFKSLNVNKNFKMVEPIFESTGNPNAAVDFNTDFNIRLPTGAPQTSSPNAAIWGTSLWGVGIWGTEGIIFRGWRGVRGSGRAGSIRIRINSSTSNTSWISTNIRFTKGGQL